MTEDAEFLTPSYIVEDESGELRNMYQPEYFGNLQGTEPGFDPASGALSNLPSQNGCVSSEFQLAVIMGSVNLDTTFIQAGEAPLIMFIPEDGATAALERGVLNLPATNELCCDVYFSGMWSRKSDEVGNLDAWKGITFANEIANERDTYIPDPSYGIMEGYRGINGDPANQLPWYYWDAEACAQIAPEVNAAALEQYKGMTVEGGLAILDEMVQYFAPRACITLDLGCAGITTGLQEPLVENERIAVSPNPSNNQFTFETSADKPMESIHIYSITGSLVYKTEVFNSMITLSNLDLPNGQYIAKVTFEDGVASKKLTVTE